MSRMLKICLILCVAAATTAAAAPKKNPDVEKTIKSQLVKQSFTTKIVVGSYIPCPPNVNSSGRNDAVKLIDTELSLNGSIQYLARAGCFYRGGMSFDTTRFYVTGGFSSQPDDKIDPGTTVWVTTVDFKDDRVEVILDAHSPVYGGGIGKIKYMMGPEYRTWPADQVMEVIARGLVIPAYETLSELNSQYDIFRSRLDEAERKYNSQGGDAASKLDNALALKKVLEVLQKNRADYTALGKSDPQAGIYSEKLNALTPEIARLSEDARKDRVTLLRNQMQAQLPEISEVQNQVRQKPPATLAEWQQRYDSAARYSTLLDERQRLFAKLQEDNEAPSPDDTKNLNENKAEIDTVNQALEQSHQKLQLADLNSQYGQLAKKRAQKLDAYTRAFGTGKEKAALQDLVIVLGQMVTNREQAAGLGDKTAATQLTQCRAEANKYRRKLSPGDPLAANPEGAAPKKLVISSGDMAGMIVMKTTPVYPPIAKAQHVSGTVVLQATISKSGSVENLHVLSGPDALQQAAVNAVRQWRYRPYQLNGEPVEVETTVNVIFTLGG